MVRAAEVGTGEVETSEVESIAGDKPDRFLIF